MNFEQFKTIFEKHGISPGMEMVPSEQYKELLETVAQEMGDDAAEYCMHCFRPEGSTTKSVYRFLIGSWEDLQKELTRDK